MNLSIACRNVFLRLLIIDRIHCVQACNLVSCKQHMIWIFFKKGGFIGDFIVES